MDPAATASPTAQADADSTPHIVRGPDGKWKVLPAKETFEEQRRQLDRIALAGHLTGRVNRPMVFTA